MIVGVSWSTTRWIFGQCRTFKLLQRGLCWASGGVEDFPRVRLFPDDEDVEDLVEAQSVEEILSRVGDEPRRNFQGLASLLDVQKMFFRVLPKFHQEKEDFLTKHAYTSKLKEDPRFIRMVDRVIEFASDVEDEPVACAFLSLHKMHFESRGREMANLYGELSRRGWLSRPALSRTLVVLRAAFPLWASAQWQANLHSHVADMSSDLDVRLCAISLLAAHEAAHGATKRLFVQKVLDGTCAEELEAVTLCKLLLLLAEIRRETEVGGTNAAAQKVSNALRPKMRQLAVIDLLALLRLFRTSGPMQPMCVIEGVKERLHDFLGAEGGEPRADLLAAVFPFLHQKDKNHVVAIAQRLIRKQDTPWDTLRSHVFGLVHVVRRASATDENLAQFFWRRLAEEIENLTPRQLLRLAGEFVGARIQVPEFEFAAGAKLREFLENPHFLFAPSDVAKAAAFLALQGDAHASLVNATLARVLPQLDAGNLCQVARALRSAHQRDNGVFSEFLWAALQTRALEEKFSVDEFSVARLHVVLGVADGADALVFHLTRRGDFDSNAALQALDVCAAADVFCAPLLRQVAALIEENSDAVHPHVFTRFAALAFAHGANFLQQSTFKTVAINMQRYMDFYEGRELLSGVLGLAYFGAIEPALLRHIFSLPFLDALDNQIKHTKRWRVVRRVLCELNRAVCIELPEAHVPWFHQHFCETKAALEMNNCFNNSHHKNYLHADVAAALEDLFGPKHVEAKVFSPYFHSIDFLIEFDESGRAIPPQLDKMRQTKTLEEKNVERVAVCVLSRDSYTHGGSQLRGRFKLRRRHLEILGFKVVDVEAKRWDAMGTDSQRNKNFLLDQINPKKNKNRLEFSATTTNKNESLW